MNNPKISVIIPLYNAKRFIVPTVNALLNQTFKDIEILIMDDCSMDEGPELVKSEFRDNEKVIYHKMEQNGGPAKARNKGIDMARGEYVAFLDSDDGMVPDALEKLYDAADKFNADVVQSAGSLIPAMYPTPDDIMTVPFDKLKKHTKDALTKEPMLLESDYEERITKVMNASLGGNVWGKLFRTAFLRDNKLYMPDIKMSEDIIMCLECAMLAKRYVVTPYYSVIYRMIGDSLSKGTKSPAFMKKLLVATFGGDTVVKNFMKNHEFFIENPKWQDKVIAWMDGAMEDCYIRPCYQEVGREALEEDEGISEIFDKYFGDLAGYVKYQFYQNHDNLPQVIDYFDNKTLLEGLLNS